MRAGYEVDFINDNYIYNLLEESKNVSKDEIQAILDKADKFEGLSHLEVAKLLMCEDKDLLTEMFKISRKIKEHIYGDRVVMFAPIYVSDYCVNECTYCGFKHCNKFERKKLSKVELENEVRSLVAMGHKRLAVEAGEDPVNCSIDYILECLDTIYNTKLDTSGEVRRANVNIAATTVENFKRLKQAEIGTYILFQETYNKETYKKFHVKGPKSSYEYHTTAFHRAMEAGIDDVGGGVLFGLHDNAKYEVLALMLHNEELEHKFGVGFHTISMPRIKKAQGTDAEYPNAVSDDLFRKLVAVVRLAVPFTGMIISTRETKEMRKELLEMGISQISAASSTEVGGYSRNNSDSSQFSVEDERGMEDVVGWVIDQGLVPSFCTACYRTDRVGDRFMQLAKTGNIKNVCLPNGLLTLKEFALDYGNEDFNKKADKLIADKINDIKNEKIKELTKKNLEKLLNGKRDLYL